MDIRLFLTTFLTIFLAELGDKTQLATMGLSASGDSKWTVFLASASALTLSSGLGVLAGSVLSKYIHPNLLQKLSGILFLGLGAFLSYRAFWGK